MTTASSLETFDRSQREAKEAFLVWFVFLVTATIINRTIPFIFGRDVHAWTYSPTKAVLFHFFIYSGLFLFLPLILVKRLNAVRQPDFLIPVIVAAAGITGAAAVPLAAAFAVAALAYLHLRFDLSDMGIRFRCQKNDLLAVAVVILIGMVPPFLVGPHPTATLGEAISAGTRRLFGNPASSVENLFYFGFLAERLSKRFGRPSTAFIIGLMYVTHEMTNPEYWYEKMNFPMVFFGVTIYAAIYLWRRNIVVLWLGDGLGRMVRMLL